MSQGATAATVRDATTADLVLVAVRGQDALGYAFSGPFRLRPAYDGTKEVSVYLAAQARGLGVGSCPTTPASPCTVATASLRSACCREVGRKFDRWVDTAWYQRVPRGPSGRG